MFVLATLQQVEPVNGEVSVVVMCHTRELAYQIRDEYKRFSKYMPDIKTEVFYGGTPIKTDMEVLKNKDTCPHIIVGTPGRLKALVRDKALRLGSVRIFVLDECDKMLDQPGKSTTSYRVARSSANDLLDMRTDVQDVFRATPPQKQVMMFSATLSEEVKPICRKFMQNPTEHYVDEDTKLTLHGLQQYYIKLEEKEKNRKLNELLDDLQFNQVIIFVKSTVRATELDKLLRECNFPSIAVHSGVSQEERYVSQPPGQKRPWKCARTQWLTFVFAVSNATRSSRSSRRESVLPPMSSDVVSTLSASTWPSTTTCLLMPARTCTVSVVQDDLVPRVWPSRSSAPTRTRRSSRRLRSASKLPFRKFEPYGFSAHRHV